MKERMGPCEHGTMRGEEICAAAAAGGPLEEAAQTPSASLSTQSLIASNTPVLPASKRPRNLWALSSPAEN